MSSPNIKKTCIHDDAREAEDGAATKNAAARSKANVIANDENGLDNAAASTSANHDDQSPTASSLRKDREAKQRLSKPQPLAEALSPAFLRPDSSETAAVRSMTRELDRQDRIAKTAAKRSVTRQGLTNEGPEAARARTVDKSDGLLRSSARSMKMGGSSSKHSMRAIPAAPTATAPCTKATNELAARTWTQRSALDNQVNVSSVSAVCGTLQPGAFREGGSSQSNSNQGIITRGGDSSQLHQQQSTSLEVGGPLVTAFVVEENDHATREEIRNEIREEMLQNAVAVDGVQVQGVEAARDGNSLTSEDATVALWSKRKKLAVLSACLVLLVAIVCISIAISGAGSPRISGGNENNEVSSANTTETPKLPYESLPMLEQVRKKGYVNCGVFVSSYGLGYGSQASGGEGMNIHHCRAIALVAVGNPKSIQLTRVTSKDRFDFLHNNSVDVLATSTTMTMGRDVYETSTVPDMAQGTAFSVPFFHAGLAFGGDPSMVECADNLDALSGNCRNLKVCVGQGTSHAPIIAEIFPEAFAVRATVDEHIELLINGTCNVLVRDSVDLPESNIRASGYPVNKPYKMGKNIFSREPLALATRQDDFEWTGLVNSVIQLMFTAESLNLTADEAQKLLSYGLVLPLDIDTYSNNDLYSRMVRIVAEFGNYAELYGRTVETLVPRNFPNVLYTAGTKDTTSSHGLLSYAPYGNLNTIGPGPLPGLTLETVISRGHLRCGVFLRPGFAEYNSTTNSWSGFDVEFCKAVNAAAHLGEIDTVEYISLLSTGHAQSLLENSTIDVVAGERVTLEKESLMDFSPSYYYDNDGQSFAMATGPGDPQFSDFVYWVVMTTIYAEEEGITMGSLRNNPELIPSVALFGERLKPMFYDCISAVGSYSEIYKRSLQDMIPRSGGNLLNRGLNGPQQVAVPIS